MSDYAEHLYRIGTGWLGWSDQQTMRTSIHRIMIAHEGRMQVFDATVPGFHEARQEARKAAENPPPPPDEVADMLRKGFAFFANVNGTPHR